MNNKLEGKVAYITGSGRGIGQCIALKLASEGANVVINDLTEEPAQETAEKVRALGREAEIVVGDVTTADFGDRFIKAGVDKFNAVDIIVNNAGYPWDGVIQKYTDEQFDAMMDVHVKAPFRILRAASKFIRPAAKAGLIGFTKAVALETASKGITVNAIAPGYIATEMVKAVPEDVLNTKILPFIPTGRLGEPEEIGRCVVFLASDDAGFITGSMLTANGGQYMA